MTSWHSKLFAMFLALAMFSIIASPANAKSRHHRRHGRHGATHHAAKHRSPNHN
jgi:hypothetical protein